MILSSWFLALVMFGLVFLAGTAIGAAFSSSKAPATTLATAEKPHVPHAQSHARAHAPAHSAHASKPKPLTKEQKLEKWYAEADAEVEATDAATDSDSTDSATSPALALPPGPPTTCREPSSPSDEAGALPFAFQMAAGGAEAAERLLIAAEALLAPADVFPTDLAASSIASPPFGQKEHARHLHHMQWNFMNFWLQKAWHCAVGVSALCCETHCVSPCDPTAVDTLTPDGSVTVPFDASWFCVDVDESPAVRLCSRDTFALITNASPQITAIQITIWRTGLPFEGAAFAMVLEGESGASVVGR